MFRCYSRRFKFFKGAICIQAKIGRTEILRIYRQREENSILILCKMKNLTPFFENEYKTTMSNILFV